MKIWLIIFLVLMVSHRVWSQSRLVVNTTCLELAKPSNQQLRLTCSQYDYHCLLDETFTKEFEACREWKWIPRGKRNWVSEILKMYTKTIVSTVSKKHCLTVRRKMIYPVEFNNNTCTCIRSQFKMKTFKILFFHH